MSVFTFFDKFYAKRNLIFYCFYHVFVFSISIFFTSFAYGLTLYTYPQDSQPKYIKTDSSIEGLCNDIISEINNELKRLGINILCKSTSLYTKDEIVNALARNEIQIFVGLGYLEEDESKGIEYIRFPLYSTRQVFTILKDNKNILISFNDIKKSRVGVIKGTRPAKTLSGFINEKNFFQFQTPKDAISALDDGQVDAIFWSSIFHGYYASKYTQKYYTFNYPGEKFYQYVAVNKNLSSGVKEILYRTIRKINENGTIQKLISKYKLDNYVQPGNVVEILTINWKPYEWYDEIVKEWNGVDVDTVKSVFKSLGFEVIILTYPWERCLDFMKYFMFDGIMSLRKTQQREEFLIFPKEVLSTGNDVLFKLKSNPIIFQSLESIPKTALCIYGAGYAYPDWFWNAPFRKEPVDDDITGFLMLKNKRADFFICNVLVGTFLTQDLKMADIVEHSPFFGKKSDYYVAFSKNFHGSFLSEIFSKQLSEFKKTKEYQSILRKYGIEYRTLWK